MSIILIITICLLVIVTAILIWGGVTNWKFIPKKKEYAQLDENFKNNFFKMFDKNDIYKNLDMSKSEKDPQGWIDPVFSQTCNKYLSKSCKIIIEVGTWKGKSAIIMGNILKNKGINAKIICIDTWLGAPEFWKDNKQEKESNDTSRFLYRKNGYPTVYYTFISNVKLNKLEDYIIPFPISSIQGANVLQHYKILADVIYIDASHEKGDVYNDISAFHKLLKKGGIMFGDDYSWPGVIHDVDKFSSEKNINKTITGRLWEIKS